MRMILVPWNSFKTRIRKIQQTQNLLQLIFQRNKTQSIQKTKKMINSFVKWLFNGLLTV